MALEKASGSGVSAKKHIFSGLLARARERNTMLARERKKKGTLAKSPQVPHSETAATLVAASNTTIATGAATDARETCMAQLVLVAQQSRVIGELEMKLAKMEEDKVRLQNENTQLKFALKLNTKTIEGLRGELQKLAQAHQRTLNAKGGSKRGSAVQTPTMAVVGRMCDSADLNSRKAKSRAVGHVLGELFRQAQGSGDDAVAVVEGIMNNKTMKQLLEGKALFRSTQKERVVTDDIITELVATIEKIKRSSRSSTEWHMYQSVLNAIVPANYAHPRLMAELIGVTYRKVHAVAIRKAEINETGDMSVGHVPKTRSDSFRILHAGTVIHSPIESLNANHSFFH